MSGTFDVERARRETRGCEEVLHLNNAGASLMPACVSDALHDYLHEEERRGGYETANARDEALERFYGATAELIGAGADEIAFAENATRAFDMAFYAFRFEPGDRILTAIAEYGSNVIAYLQQARRYGVEIVYVPDDEYGQLDVAALERLVDERTKLISISHIPTGGGLVNPAAEVGRVARAAGVPYLLDACQSLGQLRVDVDEIGCDILSGTGRKYLRGPRGTGLLYVRREMCERLEPPFLDQHAADLISPRDFTIRSDARRFENWEQNFAGKAALGVAIDYALSFGMEATEARVIALAAGLRERLSAIDGVTVTDVGRLRGAIVTFTSDRLGAKAIKAALDARSINVSVSDGSGSLVSFEQRDLTSVVRASVHYFNTEAELDRFAAVLAEILAP